MEPRQPERMPDESYESLRRNFRWQMPDRFNLAEACLSPRHGDRDALAIAHVTEEGVERWTYRMLDRDASRLANALDASGIRAGDRLAILLPQIPETAVAHIAGWKIGAVTVPLSVLFGSEALRYRLADCGAAALITVAGCAEKVDAVRGELPALRTIVSVDGPAPGAVVLRDFLDAAADICAARRSAPDDPALMIYTSGTTGQPKGALHGHRVLLGHLPGFGMTHGAPEPGDRAWTPSDWAWAGGLLNLLLPALHLGVPVVACRSEKFDPEAAFALMARHGVRNAFIPPTALKMMRSVPAAARAGLSLRTLGSAGEALGSETYEWARAALGVPVDEFYGQTECNYVLASSARLGVSRAGAIGKAVPGHDVAILGADGAVAAGTPGEIAIRAPDPVMFLSYWNRAEATREKYRDGYLLTGDQGVMDGEGYVRFVGRDDDIITSSGYRIGPAEIEDCLAAHPAVRLAAVVGKPDPLRTEIVKAYVVLEKGAADGVEDSEALKAEIGAFVRERLSAHEYPREVAFVDQIPLTTTGKVIRRHFRDAARREAGVTIEEEAVPEV